VWLANCYFASHWTCNVVTWVLQGLRWPDEVFGRDRYSHFSTFNLPIFRAIRSRCHAVPQAARIGVGRWKYSREVGSSTFLYRSEGAPLISSTVKDVKDVCAAARIAIVD
jgi:hypothetical protein